MPSMAPEYELVESDESDRFGIDSILIIKVNNQFVKTRWTSIGSDSICMSYSMFCQNF